MYRPTTLVCICDLVLSHWPVGKQTVGSGVDTHVPYTSSRKCVRIRESLLLEKGNVGSCTSNHMNVCVCGVYSFWG